MFILKMRILLVTEQMRVVGWVGPGWAMRGRGLIVLEHNPILRIPERRPR